MKSMSRDDARVWYPLAAVALVTGLALRLSLATVAKTPGHGDSAFYYTVASNIVDGRGLVVDYVVYFFAGLVPITHYAADFWNPLAEILLSLPMMLLGKSLFNALLASIAAGFVPPVVAYFAAKRILRSTPLAIASGILTFFAPYEIWVSVRTEAIIFFGAFGALAILFAIDGLDRPRSFLIAALCTGLAHLVRQDGILLLGALIVSIAFARASLRSRLLLAVAALGIHAVVVSPLAIRNYATFGSPMPPGPSSTAFMTSYEDFHAYGKEMDWNTLRAEWGIRGIITRRLHAGAENLAQVKYFADPLFVILFSLGIVDRIFIHRQAFDARRLIPAGLFALFAYFFYTLIASFSGPGTLPKSLAVVSPFMCIVIVALMASYLRPGTILATGLIALSIYGARSGYTSNYQSALYYNRIFADYGSVKKLVLDDAAARGLRADQVIVMARDVWDVYAATGFKSVMIPNNDMGTILDVAEHYGVNYMLLPAPRKALEDVYLGTTPNPAFRWIGSVKGTDWSVFRLNPGASRSP
jgi:4-amino-4-deoxy-L-arabinose transferase-like glycosyltransferase